jgi:hypothetical protein
VREPSLPHSLWISIDPGLPNFRQAFRGYRAGPTLSTPGNVPRQGRGPGRGLRARVGVPIEAIVGSTAATRLVTGYGDGRPRGRTPGRPSPARI